MMTDEEARQIIERAVARKCVGRQTPKKPIWQTMRLTDGGKFGFCPFCNNEVYFGMEHCQKCEQALDWSNEE